MYVPKQYMMQSFGIRYFLYLAVLAFFYTKYSQFSGPLSEGEGIKG